MTSVNILLVDDNPENLMALEGLLERSEHNLIKAGSGKEALRWLLDQDFAVILLDVRMPTMDGFETATLIRGRERSSHTPIIFLTGYESNTANLFKGYSLGAVDYLVKPLVPEVLKAKVAVFVELFRTNQDLQYQLETIRGLKHDASELERINEERQQLLAREQAARAEAEQAVRERDELLIDNAQLYDRAKRAAIVAERNRLANELHDTISQSLWSISLITERLPAIWKFNIEEGQGGLITLHELAQSALAEMRSLFLELRPRELINANFGDLIHQLGTVMTDRTGLKFSVKVETQDPLPPGVKLILYRVTQEALNNIALHASATEVEIYFRSHSGCVELTIQDNGCGFDTTNIALGHLGLSIMNDRIQSIGGTTETISEKGHGTLVKVGWDSSYGSEGDASVIQ